jgi:4-amino-4-deoxy-L-arabinose transferase-like glycosyltransferase
MATPFGTRLAGWLKTYRVPLLFALLVLAMIPMRDLWSPDEPDFAQCVREMRERGSWLLPYLNGQPYSEKPILFYWVMKASVLAGERLTGGLGFTHGIAAWALRLPSGLAAIGFLFGFRRWGGRFLPAGRADLAATILAVVPIWVFQSQMIQIDMLFAALLAWSWLAWLAGYLLLRGHAEALRPGEEAGWFRCAYAALALAFLAKGPLALVLSGPLALAFLAWQRDFRALGRMRLGSGLAILAAIILPWYVAAGLKGGPAYAYAMVVHQNVERALHAWDHIQPPWKYLEYLASDSFPWVLLLPSLAVHLVRRPPARSGPAARFMLLAALVPLVLLSCSQSKQSKYILMIYPFLAVLLADLLDRADRPQPSVHAALMAAGLALPALALSAVAWFGTGGHRLQGDLRPFLGPLRLLAALFLAGTATLALGPVRRSGPALARAAALTLGLAFLVVGTWGFRLLDPLKGYRAWTAAVEPLIDGRQVYFWQTIRSGVMVYTDHLMPELHSREELDRTLGPEARLVAMDREWSTDAWGMDPHAREAYQVLLRVPVGGGEALLIRKRPAPPASPSLSQEPPR